MDQTGHRPHNFPHVTFLNLGEVCLGLDDATLMLKRKVEVGHLVNQRTLGYTLANMEEVKVVYGISDLTLKQLKLGDRLAITTVALWGWEFCGPVTSIAPSADHKGAAQGPEKSRYPPDPYLPPIHDVIDRFDAFQHRVRSQERLS